MCGPLRDADVEATLDVVPGAPHGLEAIPGGPSDSDLQDERAESCLAERLPWRIIAQRATSTGSMSRGGTHA
jgi:hypothetical protein